MVDEARLKRADLFVVFLRLLFLQGLFHARGMQNLGVMHALAPVARRLSPDADASLLRRHTGVFNCNPNFVPLVVGAILRLEEDRLAGRPVVVDDIDRFKRSIGSPLAAMGDMLFMGLLRPMALTLACVFAIYKSFLGLLAVWLVYNAIVVSCRFWGLYFGYTRGWTLVDAFSGRGFQRTLAIVQNVGAGVAGMLGAIVAYRFLQAGVWAVVSGLAIAALSLLLLKRSLQLTRLALLLVPVVVVLTMILS